jgi:Uma2 family endonuclease
MVLKPGIEVEGDMALAKTYYTPEEYLALERKAEYRSEYIDGQIYAMVGASRAHNTITLNLGRELSSLLINSPCEVYVSDMRVKVSSAGMYTYPDLVAVCDQPTFEDGHVDSLTNPTVIIEVLSPSTELYDRGGKFARYRRIESLMEYVLVSQDKALVEHYVRQDNARSQWVLREIDNIEDKLRLASIGCEVTLGAIYVKVQFPTDESTSNST